MQNQQLSAPIPRHNGPPPPIDDATCASLVANALKDAREKAQHLESRSRNGPILADTPGQRPGVTIDLSHKKIASIPLEVIELIKDEIERLALAHNQLTTFSDEFAGLSRLRYLNLRSNFLKEFPLALTRLPSLEILDVSRNRLRALPPDLGNLMNLKVLSMSKNKITVLPTYIGEMNDLKILKLDHNPIVFPPKEIWDNEESDRDLWLNGVQKFLRQHADRSNNTQDTESGHSGGSSDEDNADLSSFNHTFSRSPSFEPESNEVESTSLRTIRPLRVNGTSVTTDSAQTKLSGTGVPLKPMAVPLLKSQSSSGSIASNITTSPALGSATFAPQHMQSTSPASASSASAQAAKELAERHRSNSESTLGSNREKRRGMPPPPRTVPRPRPSFPVEGQRSGDEEPRRHTRGLSHDSLVGTAVNNPASRSPTDPERRPGQYFRRLSSLPEHKRSSLSSARVGEAARGILYAMSTLQKPIEQYVQSVADPGGEHNKVERTLYNGNIHVGSLVSALESYEERDDESAVQKVIDGCHACVASFRQVLSMLQSSMKEHDGLSLSGPDLRYSRTLLLMLYGSYVEIQCSYEILQPLLLAQAVSEGPQSSRAGSMTARQQAMANIPRFPQKGSSNASITDSLLSSLHAPLATPRSADSFNIPPTPKFSSHPSDSGTDQTDHVYKKLQAAATAAMTTLPQIDREIKAAATMNLQPHITLKLREVSTLCMSGTDAARKLYGTRWEAIRENDMMERRRFWEETNKFTQLIINIAELIKSITPEYVFPKHCMSAVGTVVRPTKELYIVMNSTEFRQMAELQQPMMSMMPATPLSAALGPAAQATMPLMMHSESLPLGLGGFSAASSRTGTLLSQFAPTMTSDAQGIGMSFPAMSPGLLRDPPIHKTNLSRTMAGFDG